MRSARIAALVSVMSLAAVFTGPTTVHAEERTCRGTMGSGTVDNLRVPQNATCTLNGTRIKGTLKVERGAKLVAKGIRVVGNVQAEGARRVVIYSNSRINGDVQLEQGRSAEVRTSWIGGELLLKSNRGALVARRNTIGDSLQAYSNGGGLAITLNRIDGNLQCKSNRPAPTGGGNIVDGNKQDQCARL
jgi:hypothetical protein